MAKIREEQKAELIKKEIQRRRIARLRQVRQQSAQNAKAIREDVNERKRKVIEDIRCELHEQVDAILDELEEKSEGPRKSLPLSEKKSSRRRQITENDLRVAQKRSADAMRHLLSLKQREMKEREENLSKRKEAAKKANAIMRGSKANFNE